MALVPIFSFQILKFQRHLEFKPKWVVLQKNEFETLSYSL